MAFDCIQVRTCDLSTHSTHSTHSVHIPSANSELAVTPSYRESLRLETISPPESGVNCKATLMALHDNYDKYLNSLPQKQKEYHHLVMAARKSANYPLQRLSAPLLLAKQQQALIESQYLRPQLWSPSGQPSIRPEQLRVEESAQHKNLNYNLVPGQGPSNQHPLPAFGQPMQRSLGAPSTLAPQTMLNSPYGQSAQSNIQQPVRSLAQTRPHEVRTHAVTHSGTQLGTHASTHPVSRTVSHSSYVCSQSGPQTALTRALAHPVCHSGTHPGSHAISQTSPHTSQTTVHSVRSLPPVSQTSPQIVRALAQAGEQLRAAQASAQRARDVTYSLTGARENHQIYSVRSLPHPQPHAPHLSNMVSHPIPHPGAHPVSHPVPHPIAHPLPHPVPHQAPHPVSHAVTHHTVTHSDQLRSQQNGAQSQFNSVRHSPHLSLPMSAHSVNHSTRPVSQPKPVSAHSTPTSVSQFPAQYKQTLVRSSPLISHCTQCTQCTNNQCLSSVSQDLNRSNGCPQNNWSLNPSLNSSQNCLVSPSVNPSPKPSLKQSLNPLLNASLNATPAFSQRSVIMKPSAHTIPEMPSLPSIQPKRKNSHKTVRQILTDQRPLLLGQLNTPGGVVITPVPLQRNFQSFVSQNTPHTTHSTNNNHILKNRLYSSQWANKAGELTEMPLNLKKSPDVTPVTAAINTAEEDDEIQILSHFRRESQSSESQRVLSRNSSHSSDYSVKLRISETPPPLRPQTPQVDTPKVIETPVEEPIETIEETNSENEVRIEEIIADKVETLEAIEDKSEKKCEEMNQKSISEVEEETEQEFERRLHLILDLLIAPKGEVAEKCVEKTPPMSAPELETPSAERIDHRFDMEADEFVRTLDLIKSRDLKRKPIAYLNSRHPLNEIGRSIYAGIATKKSVLDFPTRSPSDEWSESAVKRKRYSLLKEPLSVQKSAEKNDWCLVLRQMDFCSPLSQRVVGVLPQFQFR